MAEEEPKYCLQCRAPWVWGNEFCVECGYAFLNDGDVHSGPDGYSPNIPYSETQYGSGFDEEAEWNR